MRVETYGRAPGPGFIWISRYWTGSNDDYVWIPGRWDGFHEDGTVGNLGVGFGVETAITGRMGADASRYYIVHADLKSNPHFALDRQIQEGWERTRPPTKMQLRPEVNGLFKVSTGNLPSSSVRCTMGSDRSASAVIRRTRFDVLTAREL